MKTLVLCFCALLAACGVDGYDEIADGRTAEVYACGDWQPAQVEQINAAIDDWNSNVTMSSGEVPYRFAGLLSDENTFEEGDTGDGLHCVYRVYDNYPTEYGRSLWREYRVGQQKGGLFVDNDDIVIFGRDVCADGSPAGLSCTWIIQNIVAHELGHAAGLGHAPEGTDSVMTPRPNSWLVTAYDRQSFCEHNDCL